MISEAVLSRCQFALTRHFHGCPNKTFTSQIKLVTITFRQWMLLSRAAAAQTMRSRRCPSQGHVAFGFHRCQPWPKFFSRLRGWYGVGAPKATPTEIVDKLNKEINAGLADPKIKARFADLGGAPGLAADFGKLIAEEIEKWGNVVKFTGAKPD